MGKIIKYFTLDPAENKKPICIALIILIFFFIWQYIEFKSFFIKGTIAFIAGDAIEYINGAINIIDSGYYYPYGKMPGYSLFLVPFIYCFGLKIGLCAVVVVQTILHAFSVLYLAKLGYLIKKNIAFFNLVFYSYLFSSYVAHYNARILADGLAASVIVFAVYFAVVNFNTVNFKKYLPAGFLFVFAVFLRPALISFGVAFFFFMLSYLFLNRKKVILTLLWFFIPFCIVDSLWISYNYKNHKDLHPLMSFKFYYQELLSNYNQEEVNFLISWGGDFVYWEPHSEILFFGVNSIKPDPKIQLPAYIYTSKYNLDSLKAIREEIALYEKGKTPERLQKIKRTFNSYTLSFKEEKSLLYYASTFFVLKKFLLNGYGAYTLSPLPFNRLNIFQKTMKLTYMGFYFVFGFCGAISAFLLLIFNFKRKDYTLLISLYVVVHLFLLFFCFRYSEYRYFATIYPLSLLLSWVFMFRLKEKFYPLKVQN